MPNGSNNWDERELFERGPVVVFRWKNQDGWPVANVSPNAAEVFGYTPEQFLNGDVVYSSLIHPDDIERVGREVAEGSAMSSFVHEPYRVRRVDGGIRWLHDVTHVIRPDGGGEPTHFLGYVVDITEQIEAEAQRHALEMKLLQTQKLESMGIFASGVAHDFNNFLAGILGEAELAKLCLKDQPEEAARGLENIIMLSVRAAELTQQLLTFAGKRQNPAQPVRLDRVVEEVAKMLGTVISKDATLELQLAEVDPIHADRTQMVQVVMNLLTNASESLVGGVGQINVRVCNTTFRGDRAVCLTVADTGCGMTEDVRHRLF
ncbi:MAG: PAS domain-containing protein, partial [bacterium]